MARKDEKQKKPEAQASVGFGLGGILEGIQKLVEAAGKLKDSEGISQTGEFSVPGLGEKGKGIFGFSIRTLAGRYWTRSIFCVTGVSRRARTRGRAVSAPIRRPR